MTTEEQAAEDERAREAAMRSIASMGDVGSQTASALTPATDPDAAFDAEGVGPISIEPSSEPDPLAENTDLTSGVAGVDGIHDYDYEALPREEVAVAPVAVAPPNPDAETYGMATDADPTLPGSFRDMAPGDPPDAETHGYASDADPTFPGSFRKPPVDPAREAAAGPLPTLDQGLPTQDEIGRAHTSDDWRRALHAIGSGLMVAGGRTPIEFHGQAEGLEQERRAGIQAALQRKGLMRGQEQTQAATSARQAVEDRLRERQAAQRDRGLDLQEQALPSRIAATEALTEQRGASTEHTRMSTEDLRAETAYRAASRADLDSSTSGAANAERAAIAARLAQMNGPTRDDTTAAISAEGDLATMNAGQLHRIREALTAGVSLRGGGRGGTSGGASAGREAVIAELMRLLPGSGPDGHMTREEAEQHALAMRTAGPGARTEIALPLAEGDTAGERQRQDRRERGIAILPGVYADPEIVSSPVAQRQLHTVITEGARHMGALRRVRAIGDQYGRTGSLDPRAEGDIVAARSTLMAMVASLENSGIIGPSDVPRVQAAVPNATDFTQANLGTLSHRLEAFQEAIDEAAAIQLGASGVTDEGIDAALRFLHTGRAGGGGFRPSAGPATPAATPAPGPSAPAEDFSQMSDEELRALAEGD